MRNLIDRKNMKSGKIRAFIIHFFISFAIAGGATAAVFLWFPGAYLQLAGGGRLLLLLMAVDIILGPCLTFIVYHRKKTRKEIFIDFSIIGALQMAALIYGMWSAYLARPVYLVFEYQRMAVVTAVDVPQDELAKAPVEWRSLPKAGPQLLSLRRFNNEKEEYDSVISAIAGQPQAAQPELWQPYEAARTEIIRVAKPLSALDISTVSASRLSKLVTESKIGTDQLKYLPLIGRKGDWIVLIDGTSAEPKGMLQLQKH